MSSSARLYNLTAATSLVALIFLCLAWELWWSPLRPGGSWMALKALPLLAPLPGILRGRRYTHQWTCLLALAYFMEGVVRAMSEQGVAGWLAGAEIVLAGTLFGGTVLYAHATRERTFIEG
jgi:uncharacterized membrane protein